MNTPVFDALASEREALLTMEMPDMGLPSATPVDVLPPKEISD